MKMQKAFVVILLSFILVFASAIYVDADVVVSKVTGVSSYPDASSVAVVFNRVSNSSGYKIFLSNNRTSGFECVKTLKGSSSNYAVIENLKPNKTYYIKIRAYKNVSGKKIYGAYSSTRSFITKFVSPNYAGQFVCFPDSGDFASLHITNSNYSHDLEINLNSACVYNKDTGSIVCGLTAYWYTTPEFLSSQHNMLDIYTSTMNIKAGEEYYFAFKQVGTKINLNSDIYGIAYKIKYNGMEYLAKTDALGSEVSVLSWSDAY